MLKLFSLIISMIGDMLKNVKKKWSKYLVRI
jgi:hypothetical protein